MSSAELFLFHSLLFIFYMAIETQEDEARRLNRSLKILLLLHRCVKLKEDSENAHGYRFRGREGSESRWEGRSKRDGRNETEWRDGEEKRNTKEKARARRLTDTAKTGCRRCLHYLLLHFLYISGIWEINFKLRAHGATLDSAWTTEEEGAGPFLFSNIHV